MTKWRTKNIGRATRRVVADLKAKFEPKVLEKKLLGHSETGNRMKRGDQSLGFAGKEQPMTPMNIFPKKRTSKQWT